MRPTTIAAAALLLQACGDTAPATPADAGPAGPDDAYFGLADRRCLRFAGARPGLTFTVFFELDTVSVRGVRAYHATTKLNGMAQEELWLEPTADALLLHARRAAEGVVDTYATYAPPPVWLRKNVGVGETVETSTTTKVSGARTGSFATKFFLTALLQESVAAGADTVEATKFTLTRAEDGQGDVVDRLWLAGGRGLVKIDPAGSAIDAQTLVEAKVLPAGESCD